MWLGFRNSNRFQNFRPKLMLDDIPLPQILVANEEVIVSADDGMTLDNFLVSAVEEESGCKVNILMLQSS